MVGRPGPERTCVGCRGRGAKGTLLRVVRAPDGSVRVDPVGKAPGRGAYVHRDPACVREVGKRGVLARALRTDLREQELGRLLDEIEGLMR